jgi:hypothetical protein
MKSILIAFVTLTIGLSTNAQNQNNKFYAVNSENPILIINDTIIANIDLLNKVPSENILNLNIFKESKLSETNLFIDKKQNEGIIKADIPHNFESKTQKELNEFFGLNEENDIYVNGYLIENKEQDVSTESIQKIELINADNIRLKKPALNITIE